MTATLRSILEQSGMVKDDPLTQCLVVLAQQLDEDRTDRHRLQAKMGSVVEGLQYATRLASSYLPQKAPWKRHKEVIVAALVVTGVAFGCASGCAVGRSTGYADAAKAMGQVQIAAWNNLTEIREYCLGHAENVSDVRGRKACATTLWIEAAR